MIRSLKKLPLLVAIAAAAALGLLSANGSGSAVDITGNGAPSGAHYNLNILGSAKPKGGAISSGDRIFVDLYTDPVCPNDNDGDGHNDAKINLVEGDFAVLDGNGTSGQQPKCEAKYQLPDPNPAGPTPYTVWARALGKPGGSANMGLCATDNMGTTDTSDDETYCNTGGVVVLERSTGQSLFSDVTTQLLTVCEERDTSGNCTKQKYLFDDGLENQYWTYDNDGLKLAQLRFYPGASTP